MGKALTVYALAVLLFSAAHAGEISSDQMIEAFVSYISKSEGRVLDREERAQMRDKLRRFRQQRKGQAIPKREDLLRPHVFPGDKVDRQALQERISKGLLKWRTSEVALNEWGEYASKTANLEKLTDPELVMATRLVEQVASIGSPRE